MLNCWSSHIFETEASTALAKLCNLGVSRFHIIFAIEPALTAKQERHNGNELALFALNKKWTGNAFFKTFLVSDFQ